MVDYLIAIYFYFIRDQPLLLFISSSSLLFASLLNLLAREGFFFFFFSYNSEQQFIVPPTSVSVSVRCRVIYVMYVWIYYYEVHWYSMYTCERLRTCVRVVMLLCI